MRAVEFNKTLIRVSNNGISAIIDNKGNILNQTPLNEKQILNSNISFSKDLENLTEFHFLIYLFLFIAFFISIFIDKKFNE